MELQIEASDLNPDGPEAENDATVLDPEFLASEISERLMPPQTVELYCSFGFDSQKRSNLFFLDERTLLTSVGNVLIFINTKTSEQTYFQGLRDGAIGALAVHPTRKFIALAEIHAQPAIFIFHYPNMKLFRILRGGTTRAYSDVAFNAKGDKLASVGSDPDYMLTVWNWKAQEIILKSKAFSQDVYKVAFAPENDGILTTSGMGHIKFWQMSATFTGLKLQGYLGKFGASELTDISSFMQFPDGKVLSSTETGNLLLWDGGMIKCEIAVKGKKPCHIGRIEVVMLVDSEIYTAGEDGYIRVWDYETIDNADVTSETAGPGGAPVSSSGPAQARIFEMEFLEEFNIGKDVKIKNMIRSIENTSQYLVLDSNGNLFKLDTKQRFIDKVLSFHAGGIAGLDMSPTCHAMVSLGSDGVIHLYDYIQRAMIAKERFTAGGTALLNLPKCLDNLGCTVATGFADGVFRIVSYQPPPIDVNRPVFTLQYVFKPHKCPIGGISISADGEYLATFGSTDNTIFFFKIDIRPSSSSSNSNQPLIFTKEKVLVSPIGFIELDETVVNISFSTDNHTKKIEPVESGEESEEEDEEEEADDEEDENNSLSGKKMLIALKGGRLLSAQIPHPSTVNTQLTYQLTFEALRLSEWSLNVPAPVVEVTKAKAEHEDSAAPEVSQSKPNSASSKKDAEAIIQAKSIDKEKDSKSDKRIGSALRKARGQCITSTSPVTCTYYLPGGYFLAGITNKYGEGEIRACKFDTPEKSRLILVCNGPVSDLKLSASGKYLIAGTSNGQTSIRQIKIEEMLMNKWIFGHETYEQYSKAFSDTASTLKMQRGVAELPNDKIFDGQYWLGHAHDFAKGRITNVSMSYDESFLCSSGMDGGIFMFRYTMKEVDQSEGPTIENYEAPKVEPTPDIIDKNVYTIQETKIKSERDREISEAEQKKQETRDYIAELRSEYLKVLGQMDAMKAPRSEVRVDPDLLNDIESKTLENIATVRKELEWISEKESIGPNKLKQKFLDNIQTPHVQIKALKSNCSVSTFRTLKLPEKQDFSIQTLINNERAVSRGATEAKNAGLSTDGVTGSGEMGDEVSKAAGLAKKAVKTPNDTKSKLEARKLLRAERAQLWKQLMDAKPDEKYEDRRDVAAIRYAEANMGDYKLKTSEKYIVPESERVDADKKRRQIVILKESIFGIKEQFNSQVLRLRDRKNHLVQYIKTENERVLAINHELKQLGDGKQSYSIWTPQMDSGCYPEQRYIVTEADIEALKREETLTANQTKRGGGDGDFGGFGGNNKVANNPVAIPLVPPEKNASNTTNIESEKTAVDKRSNLEKSSLELLEEQILRKTLEFKRNGILKKIESYIMSFDQTVESLMHDRIALESDVKLVDMKLLLLYREWVHLKEFEKHDNFLADKLESKQAEKAEIAVKIKECQERLNSKKQEIQEIINNEKQLQEEFSKTIGGAVNGGGGSSEGGNKHEEFLTKVFKKKVKRTKKKVKAAGDGENADGDDEEEDEEDDDDEDFDDEGDEDEDNEDESLDACPADLDPTIFDKVLELRERKLDLEDALAEIQKAIEGFKKENDSLLKKEKIIDMALRGSESEIQDFQTQKQRKLNELDVIIPLRLHQIQYLEEGGKLPVDLAQALIFVEDGLGKLKNRIKELQQEKLDIRKNHKELRKMHISLIKSRQEKQLKLTDLESRATDVQMLKFGQVIDLEKLERMGINRGADELRDKLQKEDNRRLKELEGYDREVRHLKDSLTDMTRQNTVLLENLVNLTEAHQNLEETLNFNQSHVNAEYNGLQKKDILERNKLISLVQTQANEIDSLKKEIELLIRKPLRQPATGPKNASKVMTGGYGYSRASGIKGITPARENFSVSGVNDAYRQEAVDIAGAVYTTAADEAETQAPILDQPFGKNDIAGDSVDVADE